MNAIKKIIQTGVLALALYLGATAKAGNEHQKHDAPPHPEEVCPSGKSAFGGVGFDRGARVIKDEVLECSRESADSRSLDARGTDPSLKAGVSRVPRHDFVVYGSPQAKHAEYVKRGYFKAPESAKYGFSLYLNQTNPVTLSRLEEQLSNLPTPIRSALKEVRINNRDETLTGDIGGRGGLDGGLAIYSQAGLTNGSFYHECGHVWVESFSPEKKKKFLERWDTIAQFQYGKHNTLENEFEWKSGPRVERGLSLREYIDSVKPLLEKEKTELAEFREGLEKDPGVDAGYLARVNDFNTRAKTFNNKSEEHTSAVQEYNALIPYLKEPREGVFSAYGSTGRGEDIAEAWKTLLHNPSKARDLLKDPDPRYAAKMRLLAEYAGINLEELLKEKLLQ